MVLAENEAQRFINERGITELTDVMYVDSKKINRISKNMFQVIDYGNNVVEIR